MSDLVLVVNVLQEHFATPGEQLHYTTIMELTGLDKARVGRCLKRLEQAGRIDGATVEEEDFPIIVTAFR